MPGMQGSSFPLCVLAVIVLASCGKGDKKPEDQKPDAPANAPAGSPEVDSAGALKLTPTTILKFPSELEQRTVLHGALVNLSDADNYVGYVLTIPGTKASDGTCDVDPKHPPTPSLKRYLTASAGQIATEPMTHVWFQSLVRDTARIAAQYLTSNVSLNHDQLAEVLVEDVAKAEAKDADIDFPALTALANTPLGAGACQRLMVVRAYLTSVKNRVYNRAQAGGALGIVAINVDGVYYTSSEQLATNLLLAIDARGFEDLKPNATIKTLRVLEPKKIRLPRGGLKLPKIPGVILNPH